MTADAPRANPYPGLRAFEPDEAHLFFGRERETDELRRRLHRTRLLAVVGGSGSGKSSLVRSGLIPSLHSGFMAGAGSSWRVAIARPGEDPIGRLADALARVLPADEAHADTQRTLLEVTLRDSSLGLAEAVRHARLPPGDNLLVLVDQFEELFRYRRSRTARAGGDDAAAFVRLLIEAAGRDEFPIFVVLAMRSEFIGECMAFDRLPEAINAGQYLIPRMSRDALRAAISGPARVRGVEIAPRLLARLLNEIGDDLDRLPVLQHALMRTWDAWTRDHADGKPLDIPHYEAIGMMSEALSRHADEAYAELATQHERRIAERLFKTLTETTEDGRGVRRPTSAQRLAEVCGSAITELERVIDHFRAPGRAFLQPAAGVRLQPQDIVDISHESLMRLWRRLNTWVTEESRAVQMYRRLARSAAQHAAGEASLWRPPELTLGLRWLRDTRPSAAWAGDKAAFERALGFLRRSRLVRGLKVGFAVAGVAAAVALALGWLYSENWRLQAEVNRLERATDKEKQLGEAESQRLQTLRARQAELKSDVDGLQKTRSDLESQVANLRKDNRQLETDLARLATETTELQGRRNALDQEFARLGREDRELSARIDRLEDATPPLRVQAAALQAEVDGLTKRNEVLARLVRETQPCEQASILPPLTGTAPQLAQAAKAAPRLSREAFEVPPDPPSSDELRKQIDKLRQDLARLLEEKAKLRDEADWLQREIALLEPQREALRQENARLTEERKALDSRQRVLREAVTRAEAERQALAAQVAEGEQRNRKKLDEVAAAREKHAGLERSAVGEASRIGDRQTEAKRIRAENEKLAGTLTSHVDRLLQAARDAQQPSDLAALLTLKAWRWAPYDTNNPAQPAVYNTLWQVLSRVDEAAARRLIAPDARSAGRLATTSTEMMAKALCGRVARPITAAEWRRFMPAGACFGAEQANVCAR